MKKGISSSTAIIATIIVLSFIVVVLSFNSYFSTGTNDVSLDECEDCVVDETYAKGCVHGCLTSSNRDWDYCEAKCYDCAYMPERYLSCVS